MPKWYIEGADKATGNDRRVLLTAGTQEDAMAEAEQQGILVSSASDTTKSAEEPMPRAAVPQTGAQIPVYQQILNGNGVLRSFAVVLQILGVLGFVCFTVVAALTGSPTEFVVALSYGAFCFVLATLLRVFGSVALAVRDIARNSQINRPADAPR